MKILLDLLNWRELVILTALNEGTTPKTALDIFNAIESLTGKRVGISGLYVILSRLTEKGFIVPAGYSEIQHTKGGKPKRLYVIEGKGIKELGNAKRAVELLFQKKNSKVLVEA